MKRALMPFAALTTLLAVAACSTDDSSSAAPSSATGTPTASPAPTPSAVNAAEPASAIDGTWQAGPFPLSRVLDSLRAAGYGSYFERMDIVPGTDLAAEVVYDSRSRTAGCSWPSATTVSLWASSTARASR